MADFCQVGNTPELEIEGIIFKRESLNPSGSVKDRGISYQLTWAKKEKIKDLVISSSGNGAISACYFCQKLDLNLYIFVSPKINKRKLETIQSYPFQINVSKRPVSDSIKFAQRNNFYLLRPSTDPRGTVGYRKIAEEIIANQGRVDSIFIPVSSGTTLVGIVEGFKPVYLPQIHVVQTTAVNPIARVFDQDFGPSQNSLAGALVAKYTPRKKQVVDLVKKSGGWGWVISDQEILKANDWLITKGVRASYEGSAALAGIWKARKNGWNFGRVVCLLT